MLAELDVHGVVLGHSERRELFSETDRALAEKVPAALDAGPEADPLRRRDRGRARGAATPSASCATRSRRASRSSTRERLGDVVIAYEPIWAIGTGLRGHARAGAGGDRLRARARGRPRPRAGRAHADPLRRLVKPDNAAELLALPDVDGALVGGASLDVADFAAIVEAARGVSAARPASASSSSTAGASRRPGPGNAVSLADTPVFDDLWAALPAHAS